MIIESKAAKQTIPGIFADKFLVICILVGNLLLGSNALAGEEPPKEITFSQCSVNLRLTFKDGKEDCLENYPEFMRRVGSRSKITLNFNLEMTTNPWQCPAISENFASRQQQGNRVDMDVDNSHKTCQDNLQRAMGGNNSDCECRSFTQIAASQTKPEFQNFERAFAARAKAGWNADDASNPKSTIAAVNSALPTAPQSGTTSNTGITTVSPASVTPDALSAANMQEWNKRIALLEESKEKPGFAKSFAILLDISTPDDLEELLRFEKSLDQAAWSSAFAMGIDSKGLLVWASGGRFADLPRAVDEVLEICNRNAVGKCRVLVANRQMRQKELLSIAEQFRQNTPAALRASLLASLKNRPFIVTEVLSGGAGNTSTQLRNTQVYSSQLHTIGITTENLKQQTLVAKAEADGQRQEALAKAEADRQRQEALAKAEAERQRQEALAKAEAERQRQEALAKAEAERQRQEALAKAEVERQRQEALAKAEAERQRQEALAKAEAERQRQEALAKAEAERQRQDALAKAEAERQRQEALAKAEAERQRQEALARAAAERQRQEALARAEAERQRQEALAKAEAERQRQEALASADQRRQQDALASALEELKQREAQIRQKESELREKLAAADARPNSGKPQAELFKRTKHKKAILIGNDQYTSVSKLRNAVSDARAMAVTLRDLGYQVSSHADLNEKGFKKALREFVATIEGGDEVVFFYAGHGVQVGGANYMLPTDINAESGIAVRDEGIDLQRVLDDISSAKARVTVAIIDACRDNPFKNAGRAVGTRGLAPTAAATGQLIIFSAGAGQQALDQLNASDKSPNGLFTRVLLTHIKNSEIPVDQVAKKVRQDVVSLAKSVGREQVPAIYDQMIGEFYFSK